MADNINQQVVLHPHQTHIHNLYQKLGVTHRSEAMNQVQSLLKVMVYV